MRRNVHAEQINSGVAGVINSCFTRSMTINAGSWWRCCNNNGTALAAMLGDFSRRQPDCLMPAPAHLRFVFLGGVTANSALWQRNWLPAIYHSRAGRARENPAGVIAIGADLVSDKDCTVILMTIAARSWGL